MSIEDPTFLLPFAVSIIAVLLSYWDVRRRLNLEHNASEALAQLILTLREQVSLYRKQLDQMGGVTRSTEEIEKQKLLLKQEQQNWRKLRDIGKAIGWLSKFVEDQEE